MEDFNNYAKRENISGTARNGSRGDNGGNVRSGGKSGSNGLFETVTRIAKDFDGKNTNDLLRAIYKEAEKGKRAGTLSNSEIDGFVTLLSPALDEKKRKYLKKIAEDLKKI